MTTDDDARVERAMTYGWVLATMTSNPELRDLFYEAVGSGEWDEDEGTWITQPMDIDEFRARVRDTEWFKNQVFR